MQICSLHTSISCYTSTATSIFHMGVSRTPCRVSINKDTWSAVVYFPVLDSTFHEWVFDIEIVTPDRNWDRKHKGSSCEVCLCSLVFEGTLKGVTTVLWIAISRLQVRKKRKETFFWQKYVAGQFETWCLIPRGWTGSIQMLLLFFSYQSQCWGWLSVQRKKNVSAENNTKKQTNMEPADIKSGLTWVLAGSFLSAVFTQTELDSSHLES